MDEGWGPAWETGRKLVLHGTSGCGMVWDGTRPHGMACQRGRECAGGVNPTTQPGSPQCHHVPPNLSSSPWGCIPGTWTRRRQCHQARWGTHTSRMGHVPCPRAPQPDGCLFWGTHPLLWVFPVSQQRCSPALHADFRKSSPESGETDVLLLRVRHLHGLGLP